MNTDSWKHRRLARALAALTPALILISAPAFAQPWATVTTAPSAVGLLLLLPDGTVLANANNDSNGGATGWCLLTPDAYGHYSDGTWTTLSSMNDPRLFFASQVLPDGRVFVAGGEYPKAPVGDGVATAEIYNPLTDPLNPGHGPSTVSNPWSYINPPTSLLNPAVSSPALNNGNQTFRDATSELFGDGVVLIAPFGPSTFGGTLIYNPASGWAAGPTLANSEAYQNEASWVKLTDNSILTIGPFDQTAQRFIPASSGTTGSWQADAPAPVAMYDSVVGEEGAAILLPNGKAFFSGGTGNTVIYTPTGTTGTGSWVQGPTIPQSLAADDAPGAMMNNGKILCCFAPKSTSNVQGNPGKYPPPTSFFEYDYTAGATGSFTEVGAPYGTAGGPNNMLQAPAPCFQFNMLDLPDGTVLVSNFTTTPYIYTPVANTDSLVALLKPTISSVTRTVNRAFLLTGTLLNGISEGAAYGDDGQMSSNYPIVSLTTGSNVYYARTHNWSSTGVRQTSQTVTTEFDPPPNLPSGTYSLAVIANGIQSAPVSFTYSVVWVDFSYPSGGNGSFGSPYNTLAAGVAAVASGGTIEIEGGGASPEKPKITKAMRIYAYNKTATIGSSAIPEKKQAGETISTGRAVNPVVSTGNVVAAPSRATPR